MLIVRIDDQFLNISLAPDVFSKVLNYFEFHKESDDGVKYIESGYST